MSRNDGGRRGSTSRGVRGRGRLGQIQPAGRGALPTRSNSLIPRPGSRVVSDSIPRGVVSLSSSRARASILQSARQVGIHGGTFNTAGTQQFNITLNLGDHPDAGGPPEPVAGSSRYQEDGRSREVREEESNQGYRHYDSTSWPNPPVQRSCDIYYRHIAIKGRGSPLWIPGSNMNMDIGYQRQGTAIGDVGIITASGAFDFLFNICLPRDHPFNPPELPENFTPLVISLLDVQNYSEFVGESYLSSASVKKSRTGGLNDLTFESSASEGAILTMPVGSRSEDIANTVRLRSYLATHAESWYNYIVGVRGREIQNGDVRLVIGWDKSKAWGMATFSNTSAHQEPFLLQFRPIEDASAGRTYGWVSSGFAEVRAGPGAEEKVRIRMNEPSQAGVEYQNQCLFIRTLNVNLQENAWRKLATEFGLAEAEARPNTIFEASFLRPWREENRTGDSSFSGMPSQSTSGSMTEDLTTPVETTAKEHVLSLDITQSVQISSVQAALSGHPSNIINETLLKLRPNARMAITEDKDWMSVLHVGDTTLPVAEELFERITKRFIICEEDGVVSLQCKEVSPSADLETVLMSVYPPVGSELKDKVDGPLAIRELTRRARSVLENAPDELELNSLLDFIDDLVNQKEEFEDLQFELENNLQSLHQEIVDYSNLNETEMFLAILYHAMPLLPPLSVISWFDLVLRPALHEPKLATQAVGHAKGLITSTLGKIDEYVGGVGNFGKRLMDLYLLDTFNPSSMDDLLEWAELDEEERTRRTHWKDNLEDIFLEYGNERPVRLLDEIYLHFTAPTFRLQLLTLLHAFSSTRKFTSTAQILSKHPLMNVLFLSLFVNNSPTACTLALTLVVKLLPCFAMLAPQALKGMLPNLLVILARVMCWKERPSDTRGMPHQPRHMDSESKVQQETHSISSTITWERLETVFDTPSSAPTSLRPFFTMLYYLYPSNVLEFLRSPVQYLTESQFSNPYLEDWKDVLDQHEIRQQSEILIREHSYHSQVIWRNAVAELTEPPFWQEFGLSRMVSEAAMLDTRNLVVGLHARYTLGDLQPSLQPVIPEPNYQSQEDIRPPRIMKSIDISSEKAVISLQDMIDTTLALKSNPNLEIIQPTSQWSHSLFSTASVPTADNDSSSSTPEPDRNASPLAQVISGLQREAMLLRSNLNFELWLSRENAKHIARLRDDRTVIDSAEAERQGLYNKLRQYRLEVNSLEAELSEHRQQASNAKNKYADWNTELQKKLKALREEKKGLLHEATTIRIAEKETQALFAAQGELLADALKQVSDLQTRWKENQPKVESLRDHERQIEHHLKVQKSWDGNFAKFNDRENDIELMRSQYKQMEMRLESIEMARAESESLTRNYRRQIQTLEAQLNQLEHKRTPALETTAHLDMDSDSFQSETANLKATNARLREENWNLEVKLREQAATLESLQAESVSRT